MATYGIYTPAVSLAFPPPEMKDLSHLKEYTVPVSDTIREGEFRVAIHKNRYYCYDCKLLWCEHLRSFMTKGLDTEYLWEVVKPYDLSDFKVPMFPTEFIYASVLVVPKEKDSFTSFRLSLNYYTTGKNSVFLAFTDPSEGVNTWRSVITEWIRSNEIKISFGQVLCSARSHSFSHQSRLEKHLNSTGIEAWVEKFLLLTEGLCWTCYKDTMLVLNDPSLAPEAEKRKPF